jgi:hypothetical protein
MTGLSIRAKNNRNVEELRTLLQNDCCLNITVVTDILFMDKGTLIEIMIKNLNKRKSAPMWC